MAILLSNERKKKTKKTPRIKEEIFIMKIKVNPVVTYFPNLYFILDKVMNKGIEKQV